MFSDDAKAVIALATRLGDTKRPSLSPTRWHRFASLLQDAGHSPADVFSPGFDPASLPGVTDETASVVTALVATASGATMTASDLAQIGIWTLTIADDGYPDSLRQRLGDLAPPAIFGVGDATLLAGDGIGVVGSRDVTAEGADVARAVAGAAASMGRTLVSGGARGVDQLAMNAAYEQEGAVVGVLADSLQARVRKPDILTALASGRTCLVTQQVPTAGFTPASAMARNKLIYALSELTLVVASDLDSGGTWSGAVEALNKVYGRVAVWRGPGEGPGNEALERAGAEPLGSVDALSGLLADDPPSNPEQLSLADTL